MIWWDCDWQIKYTLLRDVRFRHAIRNNRQTQNVLIAWRNLQYNRSIQEVWNQVLKFTILFKIVAILKGILNIVSDRSKGIINWYFFSHTSGNKLQILLIFIIILDKMSHLIYFFQQPHTRRAFIRMRFSASKFQANPIFFAGHLLLFLCWSCFEAFYFN